ncbi:glycosyltransferase family 87 protein [Dongia rigui]|uniref:Glycosyltransferase family 87 protein n=1 Tax=Dongia rigui TaxID=940149 RepID=A0ABU5DY93_9PROT|nr:glycosyltransferase family 87 protein [Dongia rigui]MDY0872297.1 glycosyltransferase family 87 protein [Dongia rigui]
MSATRGTAWPFHPWLVLGAIPLLGLCYVALDSSAFWEGTMSRGQVIGRDFVIFWGAAVLLWRGDALTLFDSSVFLPTLDQIIGQKLAFNPYPYPPSSIFVVWPVGLFPYWFALPLWLLSTFAFLANRLRRSRVGWPAIIALLVSPASIVNICSGQNGFLSAALLCGGLLLLERRPLLAGILIGLLSFKPQLGLLLPLLLIAGGYWRSFTAASMTVLLLVVASLPVVGQEGWSLYVDKSMPQQMDFLQHGSGYFQHMSPTYFMTVRLLGGSLATAWSAQALGAIFVAAASLWVFRQKVAFDLKIAIALSATALFSPYLLTYDLMIVPVAILLAARCTTWHWAEKGVFLLAWIGPLLAILPVPPLGAVFLSLLFLVILRRTVLAARQGPLRT